MGSWTRERQARAWHQQGATERAAEMKSVSTRASAEERSRHRRERSRHRRAERNRRTRSALQDLRNLCSCSRTVCFIILLGVSLAFNALQLAGMHAVLPDGVVRGRGRRIAPRPTSGLPETFATGIKQATPAAAHFDKAVGGLQVLARARQAEAAGPEMAVPLDRQLLVPAVASPQQRTVPLPRAQALAAPAAAPDGGRAPSRHPTYRLAFTVPWIGRSFPSWFPYFVASCGRPGRPAFL